MTRTTTLVKLCSLAVLAAACNTLLPKHDDGKTAKEAATPSVKIPAGSATWSRPGFTVYEDEGRLWVFEDGSEALTDFAAKGEPAKRVTLVGAGPEGCTLLGSERETLEAYAAPWRHGRAGFEVFWDDGRLWVFAEASDALAEYRAKGEPAKRVTLVGAGPGGVTLLGADRETLDRYMTESTRP